MDQFGNRANRLDPFGSPGSTDRSVVQQFVKYEHEAVDLSRSTWHPSLQAVQPSFPGATTVPASEIR